MDRHPIEISEERGVRSLHFGSTWIQGAMRINRPDALYLAYTREMMACLLMRDAIDWPRRALLIGLGAGSLPKFLYHHRPQTMMAIVEIDPRIPPIARSQFALPDDVRRLKIIIGDGADYVAESHRKVDLILLDGFGANARPGNLDSVEFYAHCADLLTPAGLFVCNLLGRSRGYAASLHRISKGFAGRSFAFPSGDTGNTIAFAASGEPVRVTVKELRQRAADLKTATGLDLRSTLARLQQQTAAAEIVI